MPRLNTISPDKAVGHTAEVYGAIKKSLGSVPNLFQAMGTNADVLQTFLGLGPSLKLLSGSEQEAIALTVAQKNNCNYCLAAHTLLGTMNGLSKEETLRIRRGQSENDKRQALIRFVGEVVAEKGHVSDATIEGFRAAGYTDAHVPEVMLAIVINIYTNYFNHINQTVVDFPSVEKI